MQESRLSQVMKICKLVESMSEEECLTTLKLIREELGCDNTNQLLIKILVRASNVLFTNDTLEKISRKIQDNINLKVKPKKKSNNLTPNAQLLFPLMNLPIDLITNTALFLNYTTNLESCSRFLYRMVNRMSFLKKSRNFKNFLLDNDVLRAVVADKQEFYKYCTSNRLEIELDSFLYSGDLGEEDVAVCLNEWEKEKRNMFSRMLYLGGELDLYHSNVYP